MTDSDFDPSDYSDSDLDDDAGGARAPRWLLIGVLALVLVGFLVVGYAFLTF